MELGFINTATKPIFEYQMDYSNPVQDLYYGDIGSADNKAETVATKKSLNMMGK